LLLVLVGSANNVPEAFVADWRGFTLRWYAKVFIDGFYAVPILSAFLLALSAALVSVLLTLPVRMFADLGMVAEPPITALSALVIRGTVILLAIVNRFVNLDRVWQR
jgi:ABC-type spermidine/putrescine transport system permease subunit II